MYGRCFVKLIALYFRLMATVQGSELLSVR
jgi:hypothetical protein